MKYLSGADFSTLLVLARSKDEIDAKSRRVIVEQLDSDYARQLAACLAAGKARRPVSAADLEVLKRFADARAFDDD